MASIRGGQSARVTGPGVEEVTATVRDVAAKVDPATRLAIVHVRLPVGIRLRPGMFASVSVVAGSTRGIVVSEAALVWSDGNRAHGAAGPGWQDEGPGLIVHLPTAGLLHA